MRHLAVYCNVGILVLACSYSHSGADNTVLEYLLLALFVVMLFVGFSTFLIKWWQDGILKHRNEANRMRGILLTKDGDQKVRPPARVRKQLHFARASCGAVARTCTEAHALHFAACRLHVYLEKARSSCSIASGSLTAQLKTSSLE